MRLFRVTAIIFSVTFFLSCGGGKSAPNVDAAIDAPEQVDAPPGVSGLGQKCDPAAPACPANATECVALGLPGGGASTAYCTPKCVTGGTATGAANNQLSNIQPPPNNGTCMGAFSGGVGAAQCAVLIAFNPMDNPIVVGKNYTGVEFGCIVACGNGACPPGMTANNDLGACVCFPN